MFDYIAEKYRAGIYPDTMMNISNMLNRYTNMF